MITNSCLEKSNHFSVILTEPNSLYAKEPKVKRTFSADYIPGSCFSFLILRSTIYYRFFQVRNP